MREGLKELGLFLTIILLSIGVMVITFGVGLMVASGFNIDFYQTVALELYEFIF